MKIHTLGIGRVNWPRNERVCDRYGLLFLEAPNAPTFDIFSDQHIPAVDLETKTLQGKKGKLRAVVLETRQSPHIGDLFHGFRPVTPEVGEMIELGVGTLFLESIDVGKVGVGVRPQEPRDYFWMNPPRLYRCHEQTVRLEFVEDDLQMEPWPLPNEQPSESDAGDDTEFVVVHLARDVSSDEN